MATAAALVGALTAQQAVTLVETSMPRPIDGPAKRGMARGSPGEPVPLPGALRVVELGGGTCDPTGVSTRITRVSASQDDFLYVVVDASGLRIRRPPAPAQCSLGDGRIDCLDRTEMADMFRDLEASFAEPFWQFVPSGSSVDCGSARQLVVEREGERPDSRYAVACDPPAPIRAWVERLADVRERPDTPERRDGLFLGREHQSYYKCHPIPTYALALYEDGRFVCEGGHDDVIRAWGRIHPDDARRILAHADARVPWVAASEVPERAIAGRRHDGRSLVAPKVHGWYRFYDPQAVRSLAAPGGHWAHLTKDVLSLFPKPCGRSAPAETWSDHFPASTARR
ncbi:MAG: hypothetical protein AAGH15_01520 [Myxococcota bacterium]